MIWTFEEVEHVKLAGMLRYPRRNVVVLVQNQVSVFGSVAVGRYLASGDRAFGVGEE